MERGTRTGKRPGVWEGARKDHGTVKGSRCGARTWKEHGAGRNLNVKYWENTGVELGDYNHIVGRTSKWRWTQMWNWNFTENQDLGRTKVWNWDYTWNLEETSRKTIELGEPRYRNWNLPWSCKCTGIDTTRTLWIPGNSCRIWIGTEQMELSGMDHGTGKKPTGTWKDLGRTQMWNWNILGT